MSLPTFGDPRLPPRFWAKVQINADIGCWEWTGVLSAGYGQVWVDGKMRGTHRVAVEAFGRDIPAGMQVDHLCRNPPCCNPSHLDVVTPSVNTLRSSGGRAFRGGLCLRGHDVSEVGTVGASCAACSREQTDAHADLIRSAYRALGMTRRQYGALYGYGKAAARRALEITHTSKGN